jgi:hypothetical protein
MCAEAAAQAVQEAARDALAWLGRPDGDKGLALILYDRELRRYLATPLGRAAFASALPVEEALALHVSGGGAAPGARGGRRRKECSAIDVKQPSAPPSQLRSS